MANPWTLSMSQSLICMWDCDPARDMLFRSRFLTLVEVGCIHMMF